MQFHDSFVDYPINPAADQAAASVVIPTIVPFNFHGHSVRVITKDGQTYFMAVDVADILGFKNARQAVRNYVNKADRITVLSQDSNPGNPYRLAVNESGVYALTFGSRKPEAQEFKRWVTSEVIPAIRQTGRYETRGLPPALLGRITDALCGRGAAKTRALNRIVAHRDGTVSLRIGSRWVRRVKPVEATAHPLAHGLREGLTLSVLHVVGRQEQKQLVH